MTGATMLFIVSRTDPAQFAMLEREFADEEFVEVILDRRHGERRRGAAPFQPERRSADRRVHDISGNLRSMSWAAVPVPGPGIGG